MPDEWILKVEEKEYGPIDLETLRDWKREGRVLESNLVRAEGSDAWFSAREIPGLFSEVQPQSPHVAPEIRRRTFLELTTETFQIYRRGFLQFFCLAALVSVPSFFLQLSLSYINVPQGAAPSGQALGASAIAIAMMVLVLVAWPIFLAGIQFATADLAAGKTIRLLDILNRAVRIWPATAKLCLFVYGAYAFWTVIPVLAILSLAIGAPSVLSILVALVVLAFQVYMASRLFVNFLFWQQSSALGRLDGIEALRKSKELARSRLTAPRLQRPGYRGAIIASVWFVLLLVISSGAEIPFVLVRMQSITNMDDARAMIQTLMSGAAPDAMTILSNAISSVIHTTLRPLLGIAFVLLYFDAKAES